MGKRKKNVARRRGKNPAVRPLKDRRDGIPADVLGSYTGMEADGSRPVQDADDL